MADALSPTMTLREFEHGYWYREQLKDFAGRIGIPAATKLRKDELEKAIVVFLRTGNAALPTKRSLRRTGRTLRTPRDRSRREPFVQQPAIVCFHQLIAAFQPCVHPARDVHETFGREPPVIPKAPIHWRGIAVFEVLDDHVERLRHRVYPLRRAKRQQNSSATRLTSRPDTEDWSWPSHRK